MMYRKILVGSLVALGFQSQAFAEDNLIVQSPLLGYSAADSEVKPNGGTSAKSKTNTLSTADTSGLYVQYSIDKVQLYLYPLSGAKKLSVGYLLGSFEGGLNLGLNSKAKDKPKNETASNLVGVYGNFYPNLAKGLDVELLLSVDMTTGTGKDEETTPGTTIDSETSSMDVVFTANVVKSLTKHIAYVGGLSYANSVYEVKKPTAGKTKNTTGTFALNLASLRYTFN